MKGIVYHPDYNKYDLGLDHPLIGDKPKKIMDKLKEKQLLDYFELFKPSPAKEIDLTRVHGKEYVERIKRLSEVGGMLSFDTPAPKHIYEYATLATGGSIVSGSKLFENYSIMINPLGGFHHASINHSSGFCFFNDLAVAIEFIRVAQDVKRFLIIDIDVHHGNGTQDIYFLDPSVLNISFHQDGRTLYPGTGAIDKIGGGAGEGFTVNLPLQPGTGDKGYLAAFDAIIPPLAKQFKPEMILFQSGVDAHHLDPLADLSLTFQTYYHLADRVKKLSKGSCNKLLMLLGGGYNSTACIEAYYNEFCGIIGTSDYIKESDDFELNQYKTVMNQVESLKEILHDYWNL